MKALEESMDRMRHVPPGREIVGRIELFRDRLELAISSIEAAELAEPDRAAIDARLAAVARWLERVADLARRGRQTPSPRHASSPIAQVRAAVQSALDSARQLEGSDFGRRAPSHQFEQSGSEVVWQSVLAAGYSLALLLEEVSRFDRDLWWHVLDPSSATSV